MELRKARAERSVVKGMFDSKRVTERSTLGMVKPKSTALVEKVGEQLQAKKRG